MRRKSVYANEYIHNKKKFEETRLPPKNAISRKLNMTGSIAY